jgi:hypothetical protein
LTDFFRFPEMIPVFVEKLARLKAALSCLRDALDTRFYSSSVVVVYDGANPANCDLRMLDFEKDREQVRRTHRSMRGPRDCRSGPRVMKHWRMNCVMVYERKGGLVHHFGERVILGRTDWMD